MVIKNSRRQWIFVGLMVVVANVACSLLSQTLSNESVQISPTRTPLPTFTPTSEAQTLVIPPTETPLPPQEVPAAEPLPADTPVPEQAAPAVEQTTEPQEDLAANSNDGEGGSEVAEEDNPPSEVPATSAPPPPPTEPVPPPAEAAAPAEAGAGAHGVIGKITFREGRNTYGVGEKVFVKIEATHTQPGQLPFGILGLSTSTAFQTSWSSGTIDGTFTHEDGLSFNAPGNHKMWLSICFSTEDVCKGPDGDWERFEPGLDVVIQ